MHIMAHQKQSMLNKVQHRLFLFIRFGKRSGNGHNRPFLVVAYPELFASVAMYMTSSIDEERMAIDNRYI